MILGQWAKPAGKGDLPSEGQASETDELLVFEKHAVQRDLPTRRQGCGGIDRSRGFRHGVEGSHDPLDRLGHGLASGPAMLRASSAVFAANASSRAAMR